MFINKARKEYTVCFDIYNETVKKKIKPDAMLVVSAADLPKLYDYFESVQSCIVMIYSAIEALCNVAIPNNFSLTKTNNKGITEIWDKANIEKWTATEEKVKKSA